MHDFCAVVARDHDDLDRALGAMTDRATDRAQLVELRDVLRLALAVHLVAEARTLEALLAIETRPRDALRWMVAQLRHEHDAQRRAADELRAIEPATAPWYDLAGRLRIAAREHAAHHRLMRVTLERHVPRDDRAQLARRFAIERMRVLATTSPLEIAGRVRAA